MSERPEVNTGRGSVAWIALLLGGGVVAWHLFVSGHPPPSTVDGKAIDARLVALDAALQRIEQQATGSSGEVARLGEGVAAFGRRLDGVESGTTPALRQLGDTVSGLGSRLSAIEAQDTARSIGTAVGGLTEKVGTLDKAVDALGGRVADATRAQTDGSRALSDLGARLAALEARPAAPAATAMSATFAAETAALTGSLQKRIDTIESAQSGVRTTLAEQIAGLAKRVDTTESRAVADDAKLTQAVIDVGRKLAALESRFSTPDRAHAELLKTIERLETQIADLKANSLRNAAELGRIYFGVNSWELTVSERQKLQSLVERPEMKDKIVSLIGFADRTGTDDYNQMLSTRRVAVVRDALLKLGVPAALIATASGLGATGVPVPTPDGVSEKENRVVHVFGAR